MKDSTFTDAEKRIFLAAMGRERGICEKTDAEMRDTNDPAAVNLVRICDNIEKKVRAALWTEPAPSFPQAHENDLISRQALKESLLIEDYKTHDYCFPCKTIMKKIDEQPSAQPDAPMRGSKSAEIAGNSADRTTGDRISRQAAIDALGEEPEVWSGNDEYAQGLNNQWHYDVNALKAVPSAQPEIIRCKDCKWYGRADKRRFYRGMDCLQHRIDTIVPDKDFCSRAERRTDE